MKKKSKNPTVPATRRDVQHLEARIDTGFDQLVTSLAAGFKLLQKEI